ncbi:MAG: WD40 repeat domain-containing protein, partial [Hyphomicrobiales bacterium]
MFSLGKCGTWRQWRVALAGALMAACLLAGPGRVQAAEPLLQLDTGGHMALVRSVLFTSSGELVSASDDKAIRVWDLESGRTLRTLRGQAAEGNSGKIYALALSPDGRLLAAAGRMREGAGGDHPVRLYDFASGRIVALLRGHSDAVLSLDFSPDGTRLVSAGADDTAILWDVANLRFLRRFSGHGGDVNAVRFARKGAAIATASDDKTARLWRISDGAVLGTMTGHADKVIALAVSPRDGSIATAGFDGTVRLWNGATGAAIRTVAATGAEIMSLAFSPDGSAVLAGPGGKPYAPRVIEVASGETRLTLEGHDNIVLAVAFAPDGRRLATAGGSDNEIHLRDAATGALLRNLTGTGRSVWSVGFAPDGKSIAWGNTPAPGAPFEAGALEYVMRLPSGDGATGEPRPLGVEASPFVRAAALKGSFALKHRPGGDFGYFANLDVIADGKVIASIERGEHDGYAHNAYGFTPDGRTVIAGGGHGFLTAYDLKGNRLGEFVGHTGDVW